MADLANLDLESVEALLEGTKPSKREEKRKDKDGSRSKKKKHKSKSKSKSRSRSKSHKKKHKKRSKSRSPSKKRHRSKERKRSPRSTSRNGRDKKKEDDHKHEKIEKAEKPKEVKEIKEHKEHKETKPEPKKPEDMHMDPALFEQKLKEKLEMEEEDRKTREAKALEEKLEEAKRQLEEARRDDATVQILGLSIKSDERAIYEFMKKHDIGKIRDIRIVKDNRTGKSKGIAYVEFYSVESVNKVISQSGKELNGCKLKIQPSQAEKNRAAAAAKQLKNTKTVVESTHITSSGAARVFVSGLSEQLADITEKDLKDLFARCGDIERVELHRDDITGKTKGYAFIMFRSVSDAKRAIAEMNNFTVNGKQIKVQAIQAGMANMLHDGYKMDLDDESGGLIQTAHSRTLLMQKLQRDTGLFPQGVPSLEVKTSKPQSSLLPSMPTNCILLSNMFDPHEVDLTREPEYFIDLKSEVGAECKRYGDIDSLFIEQSSDGNVWIKFKDPRGAANCYQTLNNKYFSGRKIVSSYVTENTFHSKQKSLGQ